MLAVEGALSVTNNFGAWTVPAGCSAWIPAGTRHSITPLPRARTRTLYLSIRRPPSRLRRFGGSCSVVRVSPLVRAIVDHVCDTQPSRESAASKHLLAVLRDQLSVQRELPLFVPTLKTPLALGVAAALASDPADTPRIRDLATELGVSNRTLERAFIADAGMPLGEWRQRSRVCRAIALLSGGQAVKDVALEVGYETPSAFVSAFKKSVGTTPGKIVTLYGR
jgi:AraC-like DNA-binding protein